jgi:two-component system phosphate regulon sensor histidine kinase PhoR
MTFALVLLGLLAAALALALWLHWREFRKLKRWVAQPRLGDPPEAEGEWGEVFNLLHRHRRANLHRRRQLAQLIVRSRRAAQALPYGVTVLDAELRLDWCNAVARGHLGLHPERDRGSPIANFLRHPDFVDYLGRRAFDEPLRLQLGGERTRTLQLQLVAFELDAWMLLSQDITRAEQLETMRRDFVANVSHELRTPLTVVSGFLETIQDLKLEPQRVRDYVNLMAPQAARMRHIIEDLLALSALEHAPPPADERVALAPLFERLRTEIEQLSGGRHRLSFAFDPGHDLAGAESELTSAFLNLASNAVNYTPAGGEIRIRWRSGPEGGEFAVADTGIGIQPEHLPRLTERFYRVDRGRSRDTGGTGLGLAIVKHALARHQAALAVESTPGKGSTFRARFPAARLLPAAQKVPG